VIDFQDALVGAVTYDLVSLLRDAYVQWPTERVHAWVHTFWQRAQIQGLIPSVPQAQFMQWFDWMGAQRHLKILGIFVRLSQRDGKHGYLPNLPLVLYYLIHEIKAYQSWRHLRRGFKIGSCLHLWPKCLRAKRCWSRHKCT
jgi:aminoglycoside/choline kinase family phosphotransferase